MPQPFNRPNLDYRPVEHRQLASLFCHPTILRSIAPGWVFAPELESANQNGQGVKGGLGDGSPIGE